MRLRICSDLHLDHHQSDRNYTLPVVQGEENDVLVLAGDIGCIAYPIAMTSFIQNVSERFSKVFYTSGNHEFYHGVFDSKIDTAFHVKNLYTEILENLDEKIVILGSTLWTDFNRNNPLDMLAVQNGLNDYHYIRDDKGCLITSEFVSKRHEIQKTKLFKKISAYKKRGFKVVVVTHHVPSYQFITQHYKNSKINAGFCVDLDNEIQKSGIDYWICGHTHTAFRGNIGSTQIICNPKGYYWEQSNWDPELTIEL